MFSKKITAIFICVLMVISMGVCPAFAEDTVYTFNKSNIISGESSMGGNGDLWADNVNDHVAFDISDIPEGNYNITFTGYAATAIEGLPMEYACEVDGNGTIYGFIPWGGTDWWDGTKVPVDVGVVSINSDSKRLKFSIFYDSSTESTKRPSTYGWSITLTPVGDYDKEGTYRFVKSFRNDTSIIESKSDDGYGIYPDNYISWSISPEYDGLYDVIFFGGAMDDESRDMNLVISVDDKDLLTSVAPNTGTRNSDYFGRSSTNAGWYAHKATKLGTIKLTKDAKVIKFTNKGHATTSMMSSGYSRLCFVKKEVTPLEAPVIDVVSEQEDKKDSKVVIDFAKEIVNTPANLSSINVQNAYGTPSVTVDSDASKVIITGISGKFTVNVGPGLEATDGSMIKETSSKACYIPSCTVKETQFYPWGEKMYAKAIVNRTSTSEDTSSTPVLVWFVLYDENENVVAIAQGDQKIYNDGDELQASLPNTYLGKFTQAKLLVWETDYTPIIPAASAGASAFNQ